MTFEHFPYSNFHELNLDWIITELKKFEELFEQIPEEFVLSVNGQTGNVTLYTDANVRFPDLASGSNWNVFRLLGGVARGIQFNSNGKAEIINGTDRTEILTEDSTIPYPVTSVNGQTGDINIDVPVQSVNGETGDVVIDVPVQSVNGKIGNVTTPFTNRSEAILKLDNDANTISNWGITRGIANNYNIGFNVKKEETGYAMYIVATDPEGETQEIKLLTLADIPSSSGVVSINGMTGVVILDGNDIFVDSTTEVPETIAEAVEEFREIVGTTNLPTTAQTLTGAIAELDGDIEEISDEIGTTELPTTDKTLTGAIAELDGDIEEIDNKVDDKVNVSDIKNNLTSTDINKPLSANMGKTLSDTKADKGDLNFSETATVSSLEALQTAILDKINEGSGSRSLNISTFLSTKFDPFDTNGGYGILVYVRSNTNFSVIAHGYGNNSVVKGMYRNSSWEWNKLIPDIQSSATATVNKNLGTIGYNEVRRSGNLVYVNLRTYNENRKTQVNVTDSVFTLPEGFRPTNQVNVNCSAIPDATTHKNDFTSICEIRPDGTCHVIVSSEYYQIWITGCFII